MDNMDNRVQKGLFLKEAREAKGISLRTVHEATKIPMDALHAIEEGYTIRTLSAFYYRGFIKIYAQFLSVDPSKVLDEIPTTRSTRSYPSEKKTDSSPKSSFSISTDFGPDILWTIAKVVFAIVVLVIVFKFIGFVFHKVTHRSVTVSEGVADVNSKTSAKKSLSATVRKDKKGETPQELPEISVPVASVTTKVSSAQDKGAVKKLNVSVKAKKDSWLRVETDGIVVFQSVVKRGGVEAWSAKEKVEISGKNIADLEYDLNGKVVNSLGRKDRQAKKIIITKDGFSVQ